MHLCTKGLLSVWCNTGYFENGFTSLWDEGGRLRVCRPPDLPVQSLSDVEPVAHSVDAHGSVILLYVSDVPLHIRPAHYVYATP